MKIDNELVRLGLETYDYDSLATAVGQTFEIHFSDCIITPILIKVTPLVIRRNQRHFSLYFHFETKQAPNPGSYRFEHPEIGACDIFISPVEYTDTGIIFEAVFSQLLPTDSNPA